MSRLQSRSLVALLAGGSLSCLVALAFWSWKKQPPPNPVARPSIQLPHGTGAPAPDLAEPAEDFSTFLHVLETGGCPITRPAAIAWLDRFTRENTALPEAHSARVMEMIAQGGHPAWEPRYRQHLYNSAFNALHLSFLGEPFTRELLRLAVHDGDRTLRLYALQHINTQRRIGHIADGPLANEVLGSLRGMSTDRDLAGYAIEILATWNGGEDSEASPEIQGLALFTAADTTLSTDVRVTAIHAAGAASLPLARTIAANADEHTMLRKAAIALIGRHGTPEDLASLETLRSENTRIAQAAEPALERLRKRRDGLRGTNPLPYQ